MPRLLQAPQWPHRFLGQTKAATFMALFLALLCSCTRCFFSSSSVLLPQISPHYPPSFPLHDAVSFTWCDHAPFLVRSRQKRILTKFLFLLHSGRAEGDSRQARHRSHVLPRHAAPHSRPWSEPRRKHIWLCAPNILLCLVMSATPKSRGS